MRQILTFDIDDASFFKMQLLKWAAQFNKVSYLNNNLETVLSPDKFQQATFDVLVAVDSVSEMTVNAGSAFLQLKQFFDSKSDWLFGYLAYDLKFETENLISENEDGLGFPEFQFFQPRYVFSLFGKQIKVEFLEEFSNPEEVNLIVDQIKNVTVSEKVNPNSNPIIQSKVSKSQYLRSVQEIIKHIQRGDIYEMNYCVEFYIEKNFIHPVQVYHNLNAISQTPMSCFYRNENNYLMCASPERFLKKQDKKIISQPIKGTRKRGKNESEDEKLKLELFNDAKERSENVMIVDLVRNDLSRSAKRGSVKVDELFGVYTFKQVHQLISTVSCELKDGIHFVDAIKNAFPMGSMTGAPKVRAMQLIEKFETTKRGLYSGAMGYITPDGDFDFNVVIRSILHNASRKYSSFMVGSAITANSIAESEYQECLLKAKAMFQVLLGKEQ